MDYFSKRQPTALPTTVEPCMFEKEPFVRSELAAQPARSHKSKLKKSLIALFLAGISLWFVSHKLHEHLHQRDRHHGGPPHELDIAAGHRDHKRFKCSLFAEWSDPTEIPPTHHNRPQLSSDVSFTLPASSESLLFIAHGSHAFGNITFIEDDTDTLASGDITVDINVHYFAKEDLEHATVCTLTRDIGDGIGIFTPSERHHRGPHDANDLRFQISVRFSKSAEIKDLETVLPLFGHHFRSSNVRFESLNVHSSTFPIVAEDLTVGFGTLATSNHVIIGNFTVTNSLDIISVNAPIVVNVTMSNANEDKPTKLFIHTSNAPLASNISLISASSDGTGGAFVVTAHTSNVPLNIEFNDSPVGSVLHLGAQNSQAAAFVKLHPAYEGTFDLETSLFTSLADVVGDVEDPSGQGRVRKVTYDSVGKEMKGSVRWVLEGDDDYDDTKSKGRVKVETSVHPAYLKL